MAAPTKTVPHPGRALAALAALIVIMLLGIVGGNLFSPSQWHKDFKVGLGLDLSSGTQLTMKATTLNGGTPSADEMNEAKSIILSRVNATGNTGAQVQTQGNDIINVSVPGKTTQQTETLVSETALLNFRQVLLYQPPGGTAPAAARATSYGDVSLVNQHTLRLFRKLACTPGNTSTWKGQVGYASADDYDNPSTQIGKAVAELSTTSNQWEVLLTLKSAGATAFTNLTSELAARYLAGAGAGNQDAYWLDAIAVVLDGNVITAPETEGAIPGGNAQITGNFTRVQAEELAAQLQSGALPADFRVSAISTSASSASSQAAAG